AELAAGRVALAVQLSTTADLGATLAATLVNQGFGLYRLQRQRASLEDVFLALTTQDPTQPAAPADEELS
ncbi:MAG: ABC transporter ATP-binding protein, partial [Cyanobacteria bacterium P01_H01_bin.121]